MASATGAAIPIAALKPGDKVLATNVKTGKTQPETVAAVLLRHDTEAAQIGHASEDARRQSAVVVEGSVPAVHDGWMWDLTVPGNNDHDFYVAVATTAVLVHNCPTSDSMSQTPPYTRC